MIYKSCGLDDIRPFRAMIYNAFGVDRERRLFGNPTFFEVFEGGVGEAFAKAPPRFVLPFLSFFLRSRSQAFWAAFYYKRKEDAEEEGCGDTGCGVGEAAADHA